MGDAFKKVQNGQPLQIPADAYNAFIDTAVAFKARGRGQGGDAAVDAGSATIVLVRNGSGANLDRFAVLGIDAALIPPADNPDGFAARVALAGVAPAAAHLGGRFAILVEPVADGAIGRACVGGCTVLKLNVGSAGDWFADAEAGTTAALVSGATGPVQILWKEAGTGSGKWAVGRFGGGGSFTLSYGKLTADWSANTNTVTLQPCVGYDDGTNKQDGTGADLPTIDAFVQWPTGSPAVALAATAGEILAYVQIGTAGGGSPAYKLFDPPQLGRAAHAGMVLVNASAVDGVTNWKAGYVPARP
jgi:hypothetical protein